LLLGRRSSKSKTMVSPFKNCLWAVFYFFKNCSQAVFCFFKNCSQAVFILWIVLTLDQVNQYVCDLLILRELPVPERSLAVIPNNGTGNLILIRCNSNNKRPWIGLQTSGKCVLFYCWKGHQMVDKVRWIIFKFKNKSRRFKKNYQRSDSNDIWKGFESQIWLLPNSFQKRKVPQGRMCLSWRPINWDYNI